MPRKTYAHRDLCTATEYPLPKLIARTSPSVPSSLSKHRHHCLRRLGIRQAGKERCRAPSSWHHGVLFWRIASACLTKASNVQFQ